MFDSVDFKCGAQQGIYYQYSQHDNGKEDRLFDLKCGYVGAHPGKTSALASALQQHCTLQLAQAP